MAVLSRADHQAQGRQALERWAREDPKRRSAQLITLPDGTETWRVQLEHLRGKSVCFHVMHAFLSRDTAGYAIRILELEVPRQ